MKQIRESMTTLAQLPNAMLTLTMIPLMMSPKIFMSLLLRTKKPFEWLQTVAPDNRSGVKKRIPKHQQSAVYHWKRVLNEISKYEIEAYPGCASPGEFELLQWWGERAHRFPLLSGVAKRVLMIPASSADCERHFTAFNARSIITAQLNSMFP